MRLRAVVPGAALVLVGLAGVAGCSDDSRPAHAATPSYELAPRPVRESETPLHARRARSADLEVTALGFRDGIHEILGTHAEMKPKGRYARVRVLAENRGRDIQLFDTWRQLLVTADGRTHSPDVNAIMVKRQPEKLSIGAGVRVEFDLWYDLPGQARVTALRILGSPPVGAVSEPPPADIPLT
ncbi:DUF4352 domain-containing protein [Actinomadura miaoliensis]|uniref:DUF4352 domain-containing protein n=1 Tax=Actinomadura miaoliensis TaxID=430685 RepID=A0ABP7W9C6_9ACTN